ncbi:hypothetical protein [Atribacter laminatus]|uniref:Uncharacterized protein n=1 Tax=Atribacter laminatus TaxID=2847778 RepID=A0A7T1ALM1_ATRLM|nr:hypothetical protein [Atribacter laminatus]QPM68197.1 hypothetical protein RT761_01412 [Atribacter laminatus]
MNTIERRLKNLESQIPIPRMKRDDDFAEVISSDPVFLEMAFKIREFIRKNPGKKIPDELPQDLIEAWERETSKVLITLPEEKIKALEEGVD